MPDESNRQLAAIMFADMVGYTALMQQNEDTARTRRDRYRGVLADRVERHRGQILQYYGDGALCIFGSAVEAVECAVELQQELARDPAIPARVGLHTGDIVREPEGVYGDGVNVASRIEGLAGAGGVMISSKVYDEIRNHPSIVTVPLGTVRLKNVADPVRVFAVANEGLTVPTRAGLAAYAVPEDESGSDAAEADAMDAAADGPPGLGEAFLQHLKDASVVQWAVVYGAIAWMALSVVRFMAVQYGWSPVIPQGFRLLAFVGLFVALVVAWFHGERGRQRVRRVEVVAITGLAIAGVMALSMLRSGLATSGADASLTSRGVSVDLRPSVAVLPFGNLSVEEENAYFASGLHQEVLTQLQRVSGLRVISRASVMDFAADRPGVRAIADYLGVSHVTEGTVQRIGDRLRVNVQLVDARQDQPLWAQRYDRELDDAFAVQSDIAQHVADALASALTVEEREALSEPPTADPQAYRLYLQGRDYLLRPGYRQEHFAAAEALFTQATALDPEFALAHALLSILHGRIYWENFDPTEARLTAQSAAATEALRLHPDLPQGHLARGWVRYVRGDYRGALEEYEVALDGLPGDGGIIAAIGYAHRRLGEWPEVYAAFEEATRLSPRDANLFYDLGGHSFAATRRYADAAAAYARAVYLAPDLYDADIKKGTTYVHWLGQLDSLRAAVGRLPTGVHLPEVDLARAEYALWARDGGALLDLLEDVPGTVFETQVTYLPKALYAAWAHGLDGDREAAREALDSARAILEERIGDAPDDERVMVALGYVYGGLGRAVEAAELAARVVRSGQRSGAPLDEARAEVAAKILAQAGLTEEALPYLEQVLAGAAATSAHTLRLDPIYDPIREDGAFEALLQRYAPDA